MARGLLCGGCPWAREQSDRPSMGEQRQRAHIGASRSSIADDPYLLLDVVGWGEMAQMQTAAATSCANAARLHWIAHAALFAAGRHRASLVWLTGQLSMGDRPAKA